MTKILLQLKSTVKTQEEQEFELVKTNNAKKIQNQLQQDRNNEYIKKDKMDLLQLSHSVFNLIQHFENIKLSQDNISADSIANEEIVPLILFNLLNNKTNLETYLTKTKSPDITKLLHPDILEKNKFRVIFFNEYYSRNNNFLKQLDGFSIYATLKTKSDKEKQKQEIDLAHVFIYQYIIKYFIEPLFIELSKLYNNNKQITLYELKQRYWKIKQDLINLSKLL